FSRESEPRFPPVTRLPRQANEDHMITKLFLAAALLLSASNVTPSAARVRSAITSPANLHAQILRPLHGLRMTTVPAPYGEAGPADSLYRLGRDAINNSDWRRAAGYFAQISEKYPR